MQIVSVTFHSPVQIGAKAYTHWSLNSDGRNARPEETDRGVLMRHGAMHGDEFKPSGLVTFVPWVGINWVIKREEQSTASEPAPPTRERTRTRGRMEIADDE